MCLYDMRDCLGREKEMAIGGQWSQYQGLKHGIPEGSRADLDTGFGVPHMHPPNVANRDPVYCENPHPTLNLGNDVVTRHNYLRISMSNHDDACIQFAYEPPTAFPEAAQPLCASARSHS
jgi:hypothetical protein